jgi:hypothetical protein
MKYICHSLCWSKKTRQNEISPDEEGTVSGLALRTDWKSLSEIVSRKKRQARVMGATQKETLQEEMNASRTNLSSFSIIESRKKIQREEKDKSPNDIPQEVQRCNLILEAKSRDKSLPSIE